jgi:hypothetical protein
VRDQEVVKSAGRLLGSLFELAVAVAFAIVGLAFLIAPGAAAHSPVGRHVHPFDDAWSVLYLVAAPLVVAGVLRVSVRLRVCGLALLATGLVMQGVAAASFEMEPRVAIYFLYAAVAVLRAVVLSKRFAAGA